MKAFSTRIRGKMWRVHRTKRPRPVRGDDLLQGEADSYKRRIFIDPALSGYSLLEVALHEGIHAGLWDLSEETVTELSKDLARLLRRLLKHSQ